MSAISDTQSEPSNLDPAAIAQAAALIAGADALVIAAGAGMGVDSGLPDFRGNAGFWRAYPALATEGVAFMDIASPRAFRANPRRAWGFYGHRLGLYRQTVPHAGFGLLRKWGEAMQHSYFVFTSNVDGHFQQAGLDPLRVDECHGSIHHLQCLTPCSPALWGAETIDPVVDTSCCELLSPLPVCPHCGGPARPNILMFDDWDWIASRRDMQAMRRQRWLERVRRPVVIELGAGVNITAVREFSHRVVLQHKASLIRINPREQQMGGLSGVGLANGALQALSAIDAALRSRSPPGQT
jgi:NAD-dependent SIR2 family protein deacetylase